MEREALVGENAGDIEPILYQPFLNFTCLAENLMFDYELLNFTESEFRHYYMLVKHAISYIILLVSINLIIIVKSD